AEACGIHRTYVSSLERGERNISMLNLIKICKAINFPPEKILEGFYEPRLDK
ncbi:helix-turn-helix domain-containing protein, partial [Escherichia coli]